MQIGRIELTSNIAKYVSFVYSIYNYLEHSFRYTIHTDKRT